MGIAAGRRERVAPDRRPRLGGKLVRTRAERFEVGG